jgi:hypothetical protein
MDKGMKKVVNLVTNYIGAHFKLSKQCTLKR